MHIKRKIHWGWMVGTIILRTLSAIFIYFSHLWGFVAFVFVDWIDSQTLIYLVGLRRNEYELLDKYIDWMGYLVMLTVSFNSHFFYLLLLLSIYRLIGQVIFVFIQNEKIFLYFPNFFETMFFGSYL